MTTDILIFSGQSNMQGQTEAPMSPAPVPGVMEYRLLTDSLIPLSHPVGENIGDGLLWGAHEQKGSVVPDLCRAYRAETGRDAVAVHAARGATVVADWLPQSPRFDALVEKCRGAVRAVGAENVGKIWFLWLQGESDALSSRTEAEYCALMRTFREALLRALPITDFCLIRVAKFADDERDLPILRAQEALCQTPEFVMLTRITGIFTKDIPRYINPYARAHYSNAAMTLLGETAGRNLGRHAKGLPIELEEDPYPEVAK